MGTTLRRVLTIDKRIVLFAILVGMGESNLNILTLQMDNGIERIIGHAVFQQILQSVTGEDATTIIHDGQPDIQIGIVAEHVLHDFIMELIIMEHFRVWFKIDIGAILIL